MPELLSKDSPGFPGWYCEACKIAQRPYVSLTEAHNGLIRHECNG